MSFLAPLFLFGALAVALPIVFHLIRRTSKEKLPFSSLMFLQPTPPRVTRRNRLEHILLLLLRALVLCLLAFGFARPFLQQPVNTPPPSEAGKKIVVLVDTSASMRREGLWAAAREKADQILRQASPADQVAVMGFDRQVRTLVSFDQWTALGLSERASVAAGRLADVGPSWSGTHFGNALMAAAEVFSDADRREANPGVKRIVLISDLQEGGRLDGLQGFDWPRGIEVSVEPIKARRPTNAGIQWVADADDVARSGPPVGPRLRVSNSDDATREQFQLRWDGGGGSSVDVYVPPGQSRIVQAPELPPGTVGERLVLTGDDENFDNTVHLVPPKAEQVNILFLGDDAENDPAQSLYYLRRAFQETRRQVARVTARSPGAPLSLADLSNQRLLIVCDIPAEGSLSAARSFLTNGGTVLLVMKESGAAAAIGNLLAGGIPPVTEADASRYAMFGQIDFEHPLFAPFSDPRYSDFTKIHFWKHRRIEADQLPGARVVARFDNGDAALLEAVQGTGRLLVLTSSWRPVDSQLALSSKFVPLLYSVLEQAGGVNARLAQFQVGDEVNLAGAAPNGPLIVRKPDGREARLSSARFSDADIPGIYSVATGEPPLRFAVNLESAESRTAPLPTEELERLKIPLKPREIELAKQVEQKRRLHDAELEGRQKLWRWLIVGALMILLMESWLAGWLTRRQGTQTGASA